MQEKSELLQVNKMQVMNDKNKNYTIFTCSVRALIASNSKKDLLHVETFE